MRVHVSILALASALFIITSVGCAGEPLFTQTPRTPFPTLTGAQIEGTRTAQVATIQASAPTATAAALPTPTRPAATQDPSVFLATVTPEPVATAVAFPQMEDVLAIQHSVKQQADASTGLWLTWEDMQEINPQFAGGEPLMMLVGMDSERRGTSVLQVECIHGPDQPRIGVYLKKMWFSVRAAGPKRTDAVELVLNDAVQPVQKWAYRQSPDLFDEIWFPPDASVFIEALASGSLERLTIIIETPGRKTEDHYFFFTAGFSAALEPVERECWDGFEEKRKGSQAAGEAEV